ncbi:MAG: NAD(P)-binding domain-containing protein, partial [Acidobacteria bacterium]|nr:NAD(P)-binding domain-containing protein [Acidobacteriota bacterium]
EAAIRCYRAGARVTLSYRGPELDASRIKYWLMPEIRALIRDGQVEFLPQTQPREILGERVILERSDGNPLEVAADFVLLLTGYRQDPSLFRRLGIELLGPGLVPRHDPETMETNVPGIFVAGTAAAGTQLGGVKAFIETSHIHVERIVATLTGRRPRADLEKRYELPES